MMSDDDTSSGFSSKMVVLDDHALGVNLEQP
jgi:hypothetical protein